MSVPEKKFQAGERLRVSEAHLKEIDALLRRAIRNGGYGTLRVEMYAGNIKRVVYERSIARPEHLAQLEPESLASEE